MQYVEKFYQTREEHYGGIKLSRKLTEKRKLKEMHNKFIQNGILKIKVKKLYGNKKIKVEKNSAKNWIWIK